MINNTYNYLGKDYSLGGALNGTIDRMVLTGGQEDDIYDFNIEGGYQIALSDSYGLFIMTENKVFIAVQVSKIKEEQKIYVSSGIPFDGKKVISITKRRGKNINIPKDVFILNKIYVTSKFKNENYNIQDEETKKSTCMFRSKEKEAYTVKLCCGKSHDRLDYHCSARNVKLIQPMCWNCDLYKEKKD